MKKISGGFSEMSINQKKNKNSIFEMKPLLATHHNLSGNIFDSL